MSENKKLYITLLRLFAITAVVGFSYLVVCTDYKETSEDWGFTTIESTK